MRPCKSETLFVKDLRVFWSCPIRLGLLYNHCFGWARDLLMSSLMPAVTGVDWTALGAWEAEPFFLSHHTRRKALPKERRSLFHSRAYE